MSVEASALMLSPAELARVNAVIERIADTVGNGGAIVSCLIVEFHIGRMSNSGFSGIDGRQLLRISAVFSDGYYVEEACRDAAEDTSLMIWGADEDDQDDVDGDRKNDAGSYGEADVDGDDEVDDDDEHGQRVLEDIMFESHRASAALIVHELYKWIAVDLANGQPIWVLHEVNRNLARIRVRNEEAAEGKFAVVQLEYWVDGTFRVHSGFLGLDQRGDRVMKKYFRGETPVIVAVNADRAVSKQ